MSETPPAKPTPAPGSREARLAAQLRANLRRRKAPAETAPKPAENDPQP